MLALVKQIIAANKQLLVSQRKSIEKTDGNSSESTSKRSKKDLSTGANNSNSNDGKAYGGNFQDSKGYIAIDNVTNVTIKGSDGDDHY